MTALALAVATVVFGAALALAFRQWQRRNESTLFVLRLLPASLLLLVAPLLAGGWEIIRGFARIAAEGVGGKAKALVPLSAALEGQLAGTLLFVLAVMVCTALQAFTAVPARGDDGEDAPPADGVERWLPAAAPVLMLPALYLWQSARVTAGFIMSAVVALEPAPEAVNLSSAQVADLSATIASRLVAGQLMGIIVVALMLLSALALVLFARTAQASRQLAWLSWAVVGVAIAGGVVGSLMLLGDLRMLENS
jgi:hypothetical protein